ncbi:hypothetical protein LUZ63_011397 [Rhynchospora breviuscula]|uniref:Reverse transcriptase domain-containing protein n=1 Tax=Rhynchospora breviuscula TaxID=2022672 RepID=A0A9Q0CJQ7_9POAL|nr:hypothetical protein LUZ63_011397 [Rhynchospora breviuscula]
MNNPNFKDNAQNQTMPRPYFPRKPQQPVQNRQPNNNPTTFRNATFDNNRNPNYQRKPFVPYVPPVVENFMHETGKWNQSVAEKLDKFEDGLKSLTRLEQMMEAHFSQPGPSQRAPGQLPSQPEANPRGEIKAISLRSGTRYEGPQPAADSAQETPLCDRTEPPCDRTKGPSQTSPEKPVSARSEPTPVRSEPVLCDRTDSRATAQGQKKAEKRGPVEPDPRFIPPVPFPQRLAQNKADRGFKSFLQMLKQLQITIPFTDAITQIPTYAKYLKDIISNKRPLEDLKTVRLTEQCSAVLRSEMPAKMDDPGKYTIPCTIGKATIKKALCDMGASVSLMPRTVFEKIGVGELKNTRMTLQLADSSVRLPLGVIEDVPVQVGKFYVPGDFVVMEMEEDKEVPIILGRPFLRTAGAFMDARDGKLILRIGGETIEFPIDKAMKYPNQLDTCCMIEGIDQPGDEMLGDQYNEALRYLKTFLSEMQEGIEEKDLMLDAIRGQIVHRDLYAVAPDPCAVAPDPCAVAQDSLDLTDDETEGQTEELEPCAVAPDPCAVAQHSQGEIFMAEIAQNTADPAPQAVELKPLPDSLRYEFLGPNETCPVIVNADLELEQTERLLAELRARRKAIGYSIGDLKGIHPSICTHRILLEDDHKPTVEGQRRLNPNLKEVVKKEILKLLDAGIIYPISDSKWVSPVHVVPKKGGTTVVKNDKEEEIQTRMATGWRMCIDYRKLNAATRKDHFPLPFVDQLFERLANHSFFCYLDGFSGFFQIPIHPLDQEKTTFTCPYGTYAYRRMPFGLCNAPATFQRAMMAIFSDFLEKEMEVFMDDFSVYGTSFDSCLTNLSRVLKRCEEVNLVLNWEKCHFMVQRGVVLGHVVTANGIEVDKAKVEVIEKLGVPTCVKDVRSFLGHAGFYRRFIKDFSKIAKPLTNLLIKDREFHINEECIQSFQRLKDALVSAPILQPP